MTPKLSVSQMPLPLPRHAHVRDPRTSPSPSPSLALLAVLSGGIIGWTATFAMNTLWSLALGGVVVVVLAAVLARNHRPPGRFTTVLGWSLALTLLIWPPLWLVVGLARYVITGETLGN